jgi:translation initiation factor IF-3
MPISDKYYEINHKIAAKELRVIAGEKENLGVLQTTEALKIARERGLDLVIIAPNSTPPVAKILDFRKFLYQERKDKSKAKSRSKKSEIKEIRFKPFTGEGDLTWQIGRAKEWLGGGNRVKVWVMMRGREGSHPEICFEKIEKFTTELAECGKPEAAPEKKGNIISVVFIPR